MKVVGVSTLRVGSHRAGSSGAIPLRYVLLFLVGGMLLLLLLAVGASALSNIGLPTASTTVERLSEVDKARLDEAFRLREAVGGEVWPGWQDVDIPVIVHNEAYAFLVGFPGEPPAGWTMMPSGESRGGPWEPVPGDTFRGEVYYHQSLPGVGKTPENFTVLVGDRWVATLFTKEYAKVEFFGGFRQELPDFLKPIFPYRLAWALLMGPTENYVGVLAHEAFHAYQGTRTPERLAEAEGGQGVASSYPWNRAPDAWEAELAALYAAAKAASDPATLDEEVAELAGRFFDLRAARRDAQGLSEMLVSYERKREWLEGLAKYAELTIGLEAQEAVEGGTYMPLPALDDDPDYRGYRTRERFWSGQLSEVKRMAGRDGDVRFYYTGFAQGVILDRLMPDWKARAFDEGVWLEALVMEAVQY